MDMPHPPITTDHFYQQNQPPPSQTKSLQREHLPLVGKVDLSLYHRCSSVIYVSSMTGTEIFAIKQPPPPPHKKRLEKKQKKTLFSDEVELVEQLRFRRGNSSNITKFKCFCKKKKGR